MTEPQIREPAEERGGEDPDWKDAKPGKPLKRKPAPEDEDGDREPVR